MGTLLECARHGAAVQVTCLRCSREAYFNPANLRDWLGGGGDWDPGSLPFVCACASRRFRWQPVRGVPAEKIRRLPARPEAHPWAPLPWAE